MAKQTAQKQASKTAKPSSVKKIFSWLLIALVFYIFTSAQVSTGIVEQQVKMPKVLSTQESVVVEKLVKTTKYRTEKVPFGPTRCEQMNYNYSFKYSYTEDYIEGKRVGMCSFAVTNHEDIAGDFTFYAQFLRNGNIVDGSDQKKRIEPFATELFNWNLTIGATDTFMCLLQPNTPPHRVKCIYLEPITYQIKQVPYVEEELRNVTEYRTINTSTIAVVKQNVTADIYTNRFFGYGQFFYFGY